MTKIADPRDYFRPSDTDGYVCVYNNTYSNDVIIKNRRGYTKAFTVQIFGFTGQ